MEASVAVGVPDSCPAARLRERTAKNLRNARIRAGLAQRQVSETSGIDIASLSRIERGLGNPTLGTIAKLAEAVGTDPAELFVDLSAMEGGASALLGLQEPEEPFSEPSPP